MSGAGFCIQLFPEWKALVTECGLTQENIETAIGSMGRTWLDGCGFDSIFDPDNCGIDKDNNRAPGPNSYPLYRPNIDLLVRWGEWGPEHITVPGNACGLDINTRAFGAPTDGAMLLPHNVDSIRQAHLLLVVFTWFANTLILHYLHHRVSHES
jgi:hypothetical protein